jgi:hypothetical protein
MQTQNEVHRIAHRRGMRPKKFARLSVVSRYKPIDNSCYKGLIWHNLSVRAMLTVALERRYYLSLKGRMQFITDTGEIILDAPLSEPLSFLAEQVKRRGKTNILNDVKRLLRVLLHDARRFSTLSAGDGFKIP